MTRRRKYKSDGEAERAKRIQNAIASQKFNKKRKERYSEDASYRKEIRERERAAYIQRHPNYVPLDFVSNLGNADDYCEQFTNGSNGRKGMYLSIVGMAKLLGMREKTLHCWIREGKFPDPYISVRGTRFLKYPKSYGIRAAKILQSGLTNRRSLRHGDKEVIAKLFKL